MRGMSGLFSNWKALTVSVMLNSGVPGGRCKVSDLYHDDAFTAL